jgi:hypothetical protein
MIFEKCYKLMMIMSYGLCNVDDENIQQAKDSDVDNDQKTCESEKIDHIDLSTALLDENIYRC